MVIVSDGDDVSDLIPSDDPSISLYAMPDSSRARVLGIKKNIGVAFCDTDLVCMFDDDDWSHPTRMEDQVRRVESTGKAVTGYRTMLFTDNKKWWKYIGEPMFGLGTSLCFHKSWWKQVQFEAQHIGTDNTFVNHACGARQFAPADGEGMMVASNHPAITNSKRLQEKERTNCAYMPLDFQPPKGYRYMSDSVSLVT